MTSQLVRNVLEAAFMHLIKMPQKMYNPKVVNCTKVEMNGHRVDVKNIGIKMCVFLSI